jgi:hypothetical protein
MKEDKESGSEERDRGRAKIILEATADATIVALAAAKPEFAPIVATLGAPGRAALTRLVRITNSKREEQASYALGSGIRLAGISVDEFDRLCVENPRLLQLCTKVAIAAQDAVYQGKLEGLALSLASALDDGAKVDEEILFTTVLTQLESPHVRLLAQFERNPADTILAADQTSGDFVEVSYNSKQLAILDPALEIVLAPLLGTLSATGLIIRNQTGGITLNAAGPELVPYSITDFGEHMLERIRGAGTTAMSM